MTYLKYEGEGIRTPDLTIGLLTWSENAWYAPPDMDKSELENTMNHDLVRPFRRETLHNLEEDIKPLFAYPQPRRGQHVSRMSKPSMAFPFAIWEAKRAGGGEPVVQNALKVRMILEWQQDLSKRANVVWEPLVFHFVSVGSEWKVYACHIQPATSKSKKIYVSFSSAMRHN
jgi:hypothetical protein